MNPTKGADSADFGTKFLVLVQPSDKLLVTDVFILPHEQTKAAFTALQVT